MYEFYFCILFYEYDNIIHISNRILMDLNFFISIEV